jgi:hypothetical protein
VRANIGVAEHCFPYRKSHLTPIITNTSPVTAATLCAPVARAAKRDGVRENLDESFISIAVKAASILFGNFFRIHVRAAYNRVSAGQNVL